MFGVYVAPVLLLMVALPCSGDSLGLSTDKALYEHVFGCTSTVMSLAEAPARPASAPSLRCNAYALSLCATSVHDPAVSPGLEPGNGRIMLMGMIGFIGWTVAAIVVGTFAEYFVHRAMHWHLLYGEGHRWHHESNEARTFTRDFFDYGSGAAALGWIGFLVSPASGVAWMLGALAYTVLASYSHQIQHANPGLVFWMRRPVHRLHHEGAQGNYGILVDWWDRLFGTYEPSDLRFAVPARGQRLKAYLSIPWR